MTSVSSQSAVSYPDRTLERAERAMRCAPFHLSLYTTLLEQSVSIKAIAGSAGVQQRLSRQVLSEFAAEDALVWLIQVGVLRREVDGQGITDSFRLTPLGRHLVERLGPVSDLAAPTLGDHFYNAVSRWLRLPY